MKNPANDLERAFAVVPKAATRGETQFDVMIIDPNEPAMAEVISKYPAFYPAPDYKSPSPLRE